MEWWMRGVCANVEVTNGSNERVSNNLSIFIAYLIRLSDNRFA